MIVVAPKTFLKPDFVRIKGSFSEAYSEILTPEAIEFLTKLHRKFNQKRLALLAQRTERQKAFDEGITPDFLESTLEIRQSKWIAAPLPEDLWDRRVEITGPVERKMIINALNSGAKVFMADFEDSNAPTWINVMQGQVNLRDAVRKTIEYVNPATGKAYRLNSKVATLMVRPRGWHLEEKNLEIHGEPISASLFDFGLYFFHNATALMERGGGPYFYLPKLESHLEARLWNDIFIYAQQYLGLPQRTIKATVLIETLPAVFEMEEILYELRNHSAGLNCGRWDYIFSYIKKFRNHPDHVLPERAQVTMTVPFMQAYTQLVVQTCHKRGVHAIGGMAAQIPIKDSPEANERALEKLRADKLREVHNGHDGTWVAHPGLVPVAMDVFDHHMTTHSQIHHKREPVKIEAEDLVALPNGTITSAGLRTNINVGILYLESWLNGNGAAALYNLMEDAATAEISRAQVWQWIRHRARLDDGRVISHRLCKELMYAELRKIKAYVGDERFENGRFREAVRLFDELIKSEELNEFLTIPAYQLIN